MEGYPPPHPSRSLCFLKMKFCFVSHTSKIGLFIKCYVYYEINKKHFRTFLKSEDVSLAQLLLSYQNRCWLATDCCPVITSLHITSATLEKGLQFPKGTCTSSGCNFFFFWCLIALCWPEQLSLRNANLVCGLKDPMKESIVPGRATKRQEEKG